MKIQKRLVTVVSFFFFLMALALIPAPASDAKMWRPIQMSCESLTSLTLPDTTITLATSVPAGPFILPDMDAPPVTVPAFCRVSGVATPTSDSVIKFEVWLPTTGWNGKFNAGGSGGYGRGFNTPARYMAIGLSRGYATAGTDMGHPRTYGYDASWALGHPEKLIDWAWRANHVTAKAAKAIITAFYGTRPRLSYFTGCSDGGREGLMEAQRYPTDYDGILAGSSANYWTHQAAAQIWQAEAILDSVLPASKLPLITQAALARCDGLDGIVDGMIGDPRRCDFDPAIIQCPGPDAPNCLTASQVQAVKKIYAGPRNPRTGEQIYPGLEPSSEYGWSLVSTGGLGDVFYKDLVFEDPTWDFRTLDFDHDIAFADAKMASIINSTDPDLSPFKARGGKLIMYHGWVDPTVNPQNSINYFESVVAAMHHHHDKHFNPVADRPLRETQEFFRLFMLPGMGHCAGGPGLNTFDALTALEQWVEHGVAPDRLIAGHTTLASAYNSETAPTGDLTRPLCPYPKVARYFGEGSINDAKQFTCVKIIPAEVRIEPETIDLDSKGTFTAFITFPEGYHVRDWEISTVLCEGASAVKGTFTKKGHDGHTYMAKFKTEDLINIMPGETATLFTVTAIVEQNRHDEDDWDQIAFEGSDSVRVVK